MTIEKRFDLVQVGGASLVKYQPLFSYNQKILFCPCGSSVKMLSTNTGDCIRKLQCDSEVTGIAQHPNNKLQLICSTESGFLKVWDYEDGILLKSAKVASSISKIYCDPQIKSHVFAIVDKNDCILRQIPLETLSKSDTNHKDVAHNISWQIPQPIGSLKSGRYIVFLKNNKVCVMNVENVAEYVQHYASKEGKITCFACHPVDDIIATGYESGRIKIFHDVCPCSGKPKSKIVSTMHWHSHFVNSLCFTTGGSSLLSVGYESVLVQWHYKDTSKQSFLPRLGAPCNHVITSCDGTLYAVTHIDNSVSIINNNFSIKATIQGLSSVEESCSARQIFQYDPRTKSCITKGKSGHLIFYDLKKDCEVYCLDITHENLISHNFKSTLKHTEITCVASQTERGNEKSWMATVEVSRMKTVLEEIKLKFWVLDETDKWWKLNTVVNYPHSPDVTRICFQPMFSHSNRPCMASTATDGMVKLWEFNDTSSFWSCIATASYKELPALYCDFSQDGSLLAVAFDHIIRLLDPVTLLPTFADFFSSNEEKVKKLVFGRHSCQQMLLVLSRSFVQAYDLLNCTLSWVVQSQISHITVDPSSEFMYMMSTTNDLHVLRPSCSDPVYTHRNITAKKVLSMVCVPHSTPFHISKDDQSSVPWMAQSRLYIADITLSVFAFSTSDFAEEDLPEKDRNVGRNSLETPMAQILGKTATPSDDSNQSTIFSRRQGRDSVIKMITDTPPHILPSLDKSCLHFLTSFLNDLKLDESESPSADYRIGKVEAAVESYSDRSSIEANYTKMLESTTIRNIRPVHMKFLEGL